MANRRRKPPSDMTKRPPVEAAFLLLGQPLAGGSDDQGRVSATSLRSPAFTVSGVSDDLSALDSLTT